MNLLHVSISSYRNTYCESCSVTGYSCMEFYYNEQWYRHAWLYGNTNSISQPLPNRQNFYEVGGLEAQIYLFSSNGSYQESTVQEILRNTRGHSKISVLGKECW